MTDKKKELQILEEGALAMTNMRNAIKDASETKAQGITNLRNAVRPEPAPAPAPTPVATLKPDPKGDKV